MASVYGHHKNGSDKDAYWHTFEAGHATETINRSREQVLYVLDNKYCVRDHSEALASLKPLYKELYGDILTEETQPNGERPPLS